MKTAITLCALSLVMAGCSWSWLPWSGTDTAAGSAQDTSYNQLVAQAENEIKVTEKTGFLWNNTEKFLKDSKEAKIDADTARKSGDVAKADAEMAKAIKLVNKAIKEAQLAQQQARDNATPAARYQ